VTRLRALIREWVESENGDGHQTLARPVAFVFYGFIETFFQPEEYASEK
jgi:hypothetical protein